MITTAVKLCECGCGQPAPIATQTDQTRGYVKGQPMRYVKGHKARTARLGHKNTPEHNRKIGEANRIANWKTGRTIRDGRILLNVGRGHPLADAKGWAYEHRLVAAEKIGRAPRRGEHVHHIDENPANNDPDNLVVLTASQHKALHHRTSRGVSFSDALAEVLASF